MCAEPLKVAFVGLGRWGFTLGSAAQKSPKLQIVNCFTRTKEKRDKYCEQFGCRQEESFEAILKDPEVEAVIVSAPNNKHHELGIAAAKAGKHVFVDKPIAATTAQAHQLIQGCDDAGVTLAVGASSRRLKGHRLFKKFLDEGKLGTLALAETNYSNDRGLHYTPDNWQWYASGSPGGPLLQVAIHQVDNLYYLFGPVRKVSAAFSKVKTKSEIPDVAVLWLEFESGLLGTLGTSFISPRTPNGHFTYFLNAYGDEANLYHDRWEGIFTLKTDSKERERVPFEEYKGHDYLTEELEDFADAIREGRSPEVSGPDGLHVLGIVYAAMASAERGQPVEVAEILAK